MVKFPQISQDAAARALLVVGIGLTAVPPSSSRAEDRQASSTSSSRQGRKVAMAPRQSPQAESALPPLPIPGGGGRTQAPPSAPPVGPAEPAPLEEQPSFAAPAPATAPPTYSPDLGGLVSGSAGGFLDVTMLGDQAPFVRIAQVPVIPPPVRPPIPGMPRPEQARGTILVPSVRQFKIAENQSPQPQDRIYTSFNYFNDLNSTLNRRFGSALNSVNGYRYGLGFEKTFLDQYASIGLRLPINNLTADSPVRNLANTSTSVGDLAIILKYAFWQNRQTGGVFSGGLLVSAPTGTTHFAGFQHITSLHYAGLQPYIGYLLPFGDWYFQGFTAIDVPVNSRDVTMLYNDVGLGYFLYRSRDADRFLTGVAPTFEVHVNTPLNHFDYNNFSDPAATPNVVDLTFGTNFLLGRRGLFSVALVEPVTGPRPYNYEILAQFNLRF